MIQNECDKKEKIVKQLYMQQGKVTELVEAGYTVTIRPVKEGLKVTYHKEKVVKWNVLPSGSIVDVVAWQKCPEPYKG